MSSEHQTHWKDIGCVSHIISNTALDVTEVSGDINELTYLLKTTSEPLLKGPGPLLDIIDRVVTRASRVQSQF